MRLAVIPARGGSKRIPRKNVREFCGRPMIAWSIEAALQSGCFDKIVVSTDDDEIAAVSVAEGAEAPFRRPANLSDDHTATSPVIAHAIHWCSEAGITPEQVCCLYATAPFVEPVDIVQGLRQLEASDADFTFSVTSYPFPIQRAVRVTESGRVSMFQPEHFLTRSQDLEEAYHDAGQFYWGTAAAWLENRPIFSTTSAAVILPRHRVQDIDTPEDWQRAELMFSVIRNMKETS